MFYCLVIGSRSFSDYEFLKAKLDYVLSNHAEITIVSGGAKGADTLAERYAKERGCNLKVFPAKWETYGRSAGYKRNVEMHTYICTFEHRGVVAFWDGKSPGTAHSFKLCQQFNNPLKLYTYK